MTSGSSVSGALLDAQCVRAGSIDTLHEARTLAPEYIKMTKHGAAARLQIALIIYVPSGLLRRGPRTR